MRKRNSAVEREGLQQVYTLSETAAHLRLSESQVRRHTELGIFPVHRIGRSVRYTTSDINSYIERWSSNEYKN
jgi:predicted DNA-binding transcriptional regulator AlpA